MGHHVETMNETMRTDLPASLKFGVVALAAATSGIIGLNYNNSIKADISYVAAHSAHPDTQVLAVETAKQSFPSEDSVRDVINSTIVNHEDPEIVDAAYGAYRAVDNRAGSWVVAGLIPLGGAVAAASSASKNRERTAAKSDRK